MQLTTKDVQAVKRLTRRDEFKQIVNHCRASKTILGILQDAFHENVLSRLLRAADGFGVKTGRLGHALGGAASRGA